MQMLVDLPREAILRPGFWKTSPGVPRRERPVRVAPVAATRPAGLWVDALMALRNTGDAELGYDDWRNVVFAIHHETGGSDEGLALAHEFSARSGKYDPAFLDERVWPYVRDRDEGAGGSITGGTVMSLAAKLHGWTAPLDDSAFVVVDEWARGGRKGAGYGARVGGSGAADDGASGAAGGRVAARDGGGRRAGSLVDAPGLEPHAVQARGAGAPEDAAGGQEPGDERPAVLGVPAQLPARGENPEPLADPVERLGVPEAKHLCTDQANAGRLVKAYGSRVLVAGGRWYVWDGRCWRADEADVYRFACRLSEIVKEEARALVSRARQASEGDGSAERVARAQNVAEALEKWSIKCEMKSTIEAAVGLARKMLTVDVDVLDRDPWLLNARNGVVDLRDGSLRPHRADDYMTKFVDVDYDPGLGVRDWAEWETVLAQILPDAAVRGFLRRWFGYCLTGHVREQAFVVHWGEGSNGKSTVLDMMAKTMGDYAGVAPPGLVAGSSKSERHPTEIASLLGRRMVTSHETGDGAVLREDFIKQATGGDVMTGRYMREDFFEFDPTHKIQLLTNHKPVIKGQDHGIWRRVLLVEYGQRFGTAEEVAEGTATVVKDLLLGERLKAGEEALRVVLAWRVRGAVEWAREGLRPPDAVREASSRYREESDRVLQFVRECCEVQPAGGGSGIADVGSSEGGAGSSQLVYCEPLTLGMVGLYPSYKGWCTDGGLMALSRQRFLAELLRTCPKLRAVEGYAGKKGDGRRKVLQVHGIRLLPDA